MLCGGSASHCTGHFPERDRKSGQVKRIGSIDRRLPWV
jgi:hypothetical protein